MPWNLYLAAYKSYCYYYYYYYYYYYKPICAESVV